MKRDRFLWKFVVLVLAVALNGNIAGAMAPPRSGSPDTTQAYEAIPNVDETGFGPSMEFDGVDDYLVDEDFGLDIEDGVIDQLTVESWVNFSSYAPSDTRRGAGIVAKEGSFALGLSGEAQAPRLTFEYLYDASTQVLTAPVALTSGHWYHVAATFQGAGGSAIAKLFINGIEFASKEIMGGDGKLPLGDQPLFVGRYAEGNSLAGQLDELRISNVVRYPYKFTMPRAPFASDPNTLALYHLGATLDSNEGEKVPVVVGNPVVKDESGISSMINPSFEQSSDPHVTIIGPESETLVEGITLSLLNAGDTLIMADGDYRSSIIFKKQAGTAAAPITVRAKNDGRVRLLGERVRVNIWVESSSYIVIEGLYAEKCYDPNVPAQCSPVTITGVWGQAGSESHHITLRRVSARDAYGGWSPIFKVQGSGDTSDAHSHDILLEDCAAYGWGLHGFEVHWNTYAVTLRRPFSYWQAWQDSSKMAWCQNIEVYGGYDSIVENAVMFNGSKEKLPCHGMTQNGSTTRLDAPVHGLMMPGSRQRVLGSITKDIKGDSFYSTNCRDCTFQNNVSIRATNASGTVYGYSDNKSSASTVNNQNSVWNMTWINTQGTGMGVRMTNGNTYDRINVTSSYFQSSSDDYALYRTSGTTGYLWHNSNRFCNQIVNPYYNTSDATPYNEGNLAVTWNTAKYGDGAYLMASKTNLAGQGYQGATIGADVLYRYQNGQLTTSPLWPWPMENRICAETAKANGGVNGVSVTYASRSLSFDSNGDGVKEKYNCSGGLWKTLSGVYSAAAVAGPESLYIPMVVAP